MSKITKNNTRSLRTIKPYNDMHINSDIKKKIDIFSKNKELFDEIQLLNIKDELFYTKYTELFININTFITDTFLKKKFKNLLQNKFIKNSLYINNKILKEKEQHFNYKKQEYEKMFDLIKPESQYFQQEYDIILNAIIACKENGVINDSKYDLDLNRLNDIKNSHDVLIKQKKIQEKQISIFECSTVFTIPQFTDTCWFNTILTTILYSQYSRELLLNDNKFEIEQHTNVFYNIINTILKYNYKNSIDTLRLFNLYFKPENLIKLLVSNYNLNIDPTAAFYPQCFLPFFIKVLGKTYISLDYSHDISKGYFSNYNISKFIYNYKQDVRNYFTELQLWDSLIQESKSLYNPDYIIITIGADYDNFFDNNKNYLIQKYGIDVASQYISNNITIFDTNKKIMEEINYYGNKYILDSCILGNYNAADTTTNNLGGHVIAGIRCKDQKFVYDSSIFNSINDSGIQEFFSCPVINHDWDVNNDDIAFRSDEKICTLIQIDSKKPLINDFSFSFGKGLRVLIYVKQKVPLLGGVNYNKLFNSILYSILLSDYSRNYLLLKINKIKDKKLSNIIKKIIKNKIISRHNAKSYYDYLMTHIKSNNPIKELSEFIKIINKSSIILYKKRKSDDIFLYKLININYIPDYLLIYDNKEINETIKFKDIKLKGKFAILNGKKYILDSCIIIDDDIKSGITIKNTKYVYNGLSALNAGNIEINKYNWIKDDNSNKILIYVLQK